MAIAAWRTKSQEAPAEHQAAGGDENPQSALHAVAGPAWPLGLAASAMLALGLGLVCAPPISGGSAVLGYLLPAALLALISVLCLAGGAPRAADNELEEALEAEAPQARRTALRELGGWLPAILAGAATFAALHGWPAAQQGWTRICESSVSWGLADGSPALKLSAAGAIYAICGAMTGILLGWLVRIGFTLAFGREAFGVGDIYILAAAGAGTGWDIVLAAFPLSVAVALLMFCVALLRKRTALLAFGPPLAMGFVLALWLNRPLTDLAQQRMQDIQYVWSTRRDVALLALGLLLVGAAVAVILARAARRLIER